MSKDKISIVVPCYNEEKTIPLFYEELNNTISKIKCDFEIIFVNDGSKDNTLDEIKKLLINKKVRFISFSKNFGKEAAMYAGLEYSTGNYVTIMDADLQDPPKLLIEMYDLIKTNKYDQICTRRKTRKGEGHCRNFLTRKFYKIINKLSDTEMVEGARDYRLMTRKVVDSILSFKEYNRYSKGIFSFVGFKTIWLEYDNVPRVNGKTKMSIIKLFKYAVDGLLSFSTLPLLLISFIGILVCFLAFIAIIYIFIKTLLFGDPVSGWPSMVCILLFVSGIQLFCMGIFGEYLAKIYLETKKRPLYIIDETEESIKN